MYPAIDHRRGSPPDGRRDGESVKAGQTLSPRSGHVPLTICVAPERLVDVAALLERAVAQLAGRRR